MSKWAVSAGGDEEMAGGAGARTLGGVVRRYRTAGDSGMAARDGRAVTGQLGFWCAALLGRLRVEAVPSREGLAAGLGLRPVGGLGPGLQRGGLGLLPEGSDAGLGAAGVPVAGVQWCGRRLAVCRGVAG